MNKKNLMSNYRNMGEMSLAGATITVALTSVKGSIKIPAEPKKIVIFFNTSIIG
jgi:ABC-type enterochelin transport system substrate-binding protein